MLLITEQFRDELVKYMLTRPCGEVINGVLGLQQLASVPAETKAEDTGQEHAP